MTASTAAPPTPADAELVDRARQGDGDAFASLVRRHERIVLAVAYSLLGDRAEAEDMAQETFLRAYRSLGLLADTSRFAPWVKRVAFGVCIDWLRTFRPELYRSLDSSDIESASGVGTLRSAAPSQLEDLEQRELAARVMAAVAALPPRYRAPLTMFHIDGLSHAKVADALGVPVGTVRSLVTRARQKLARALAPHATTSDMTSSHDADVFDEQREPPRFLHVLNGDSVRGTMEQSDIPGALTVWADILHEGPLPRDLPDDEWADVRARYIAERGFGSLEEARETERRWLRALESYAEYDEVVLWFEHDLFDQLLLVHHLDFFARRDLGRTALSLICIGEYPGVPRFDGLGQLDANQLASLLGTRQRVTVRQTELARATWRALTGDDPTAIERIRARDTSALPFLAGALERFLEEYPSADQGLPRSERQILEVLAQRGALTPGDLFVAQASLEERVFQGDWSIWKKVEDLADPRAPLLTHDVPDFMAPGVAWSSARIEITPLGREVLGGRQDWTALRSFDRWLGGVHLEPGDPQWRWHRREHRLTRV